MALERRIAVAVRFNAEAHTAQWAWYLCLRDAAVRRVAAVRAAKYAVALIALKRQEFSSVAIKHSATHTTVTHVDG